MRRYAPKSMEWLNVLCMAALCAAGRIKGMDPSICVPGDFADMSSSLSSSTNDVLRRSEEKQHEAMATSTDCQTVCRVGPLLHEATVLCEVCA